MTAETMSLLSSLAGAGTVATGLGVWQLFRGQGPKARAIRGTVKDAAKWSTNWWLGTAAGLVAGQTELGMTDLQLGLGVCVCLLGALIGAARRLIREAKAS